MKPAAIVIMWLGYGVAFFGWTVWHRWNIGFLEELNPVSPYRWPPAGESPPPIPADRVFPGKAGSETTASSTPGGKGTAPVIFSRKHKCPPGEYWSDVAGECVPVTGLR